MVVTPVSIRVTWLQSRTGSFCMEESVVFASYTGWGGAGRSTEGLSFLGLTPRMQLCCVILITKSSRTPRALVPRASIRLLCELRKST